MKHAKVFLPIALALVVGACARPPQADIDAARAAVADAAKNADIVAYAPDTLKSAQDKLAQMESELTAKHYDKVKALALDARATAGTAANDAARGKEKAQADATALIAALQQALPDAAKKLASAKRVRGITLDFAGLTKELSDAQAALADADKDLTDGNFASALQKATAVQAQLSAGEKAVGDAVQAAGNRKK
ncbi:MAG: DUF4398 domain-containing protein [Spirochaetia bacterium]